LASKPVATVSGGLASKPAATVSSGLASKPAATVSSGLASKPAMTVSPGLTSKPVVGFLVEPQSQGGAWFLGLDLKIGSFSLVIWVSKSLRQFLGLGLKIKRTSVCWLRHKTDRWRSARDTRRDLVACFAWKQVRLGFPSLASRLAEGQRQWCTWHHRGGCIRMKLKTDGSMQRAMSDPATLHLPFSMYYALGV
jgi:hypothetical protein